MHQLNPLSNSPVPPWSRAFQYNCSKTYIRRAVHLSLEHSPRTMAIHALSKMQPKFLGAAHDVLTLGDDTLPMDPNLAHFAPSWFSLTFFLFFFGVDCLEHKTSFTGRSCNLICFHQDFMALCWSHCPCRSLGINSNRLTNCRFTGKNGKHKTYLKKALTSLVCNFIPNLLPQCMEFCLSQTFQGFQKVPKMISPSRQLL